MVIIPQGLISVYIALVLTALFVTQVVLVTQIMLATRRDARERRLLLQKLRLESVRLETKQQQLTPPHGLPTVIANPEVTQKIPTVR